MSTEPASLPTTTVTPEPAPALPNEVMAFLKVLLTPVLSIVAGYVATLVARYFPGSDIKKSQLVWVFLLVAAAAAAAVIRWLERQPEVKKLETELQPVWGEVFSSGPVLPEEIIKLIEQYGPDLITEATNVLRTKAAATAATASLLPLPSPTAGPATATAADSIPVGTSVSASEALNGNA